MEISFGRKKSNTTKKQTSSTIIKYNDYSKKVTDDDKLILSTFGKSFKYNNSEIFCIQLNDNDLWFRAKEASEVLQYINTTQAILVHVSNEDKKPLEELLKIGSVLNTGPINLSYNEKKSIYINESGLYSLIFSSKKEEAKSFKTFLLNDMLPILKNDMNQRLLPNNTMINDKTKNNSFFYENNEFKFKINDNLIWFEGKEFLNFIGYKDHNDAINRHIKDKYKKNLSEFFNSGETPELKKNLPGNQKSKIYICEYGIFQLLATSKLNNPIIQKFQDILFEEILPSIRKTGSYNVNQNIASSSNQLIPIRTAPVRSFYDDHMITPFIGKNVLYIGMTDNILESDNIFINNYGLSSRVIDRDFKEHRKKFINFNMIYIRECDNNHVVEKLFKDELKAKKLWRSSKINNSNDTELFITNEIYDIDYIIKLMDTLIDNNPLKSIQERDNLIKQLENNQDFDIQKMTLELKLKECDVKMKEFELRQRELDLKEKEFSLKLKDDDSKLKQLELEFKLKEENSKQMELQFKLKEDESKLKQLELEFKIKEEDTKQKQIELDKLKLYVPEDSIQDDIPLSQPIDPSLHDDLLKIKSIFDFTKDMRDMIPVKEVNFRCINAAVKRSSIKKIIDYLGVKEYRYDIRYYCFIKLRIN